MGASLIFNTYTHSPDPPIALFSTYFEGVGTTFHYSSFAMLSRSDSHSIGGRVYIPNSKAGAVAFLLGTLLLNGLGCVKREAVPVGGTGTRENLPAGSTSSTVQEKSSLTTVAPEANAHFYEGDDEKRAEAVCMPDNISLQYWLKVLIIPRTGTETGETRLGILLYFRNTEEETLLESIVPHFQVSRRDSPSNREYSGTSSSFSLTISLAEEGHKEGRYPATLEARINEGKKTYQLLCSIK